MLKRLYIFLSFIGVILGANAQLATGSWRQFPSFGAFSDIIDTPDKVYYVTAGSLYSYDKSEDETRHFEAFTDLSGYAVDKIFYNFNDNHLLVAFADGNMDIIYPDGSKVNLPDIKDSSVLSAKTINDVKFHGGRIYVATPFGLVIYDGKSLEVKESGIYNRPVQCLAVDGTNIVLFMGDLEDERYKIYYIGHGERINRLDNFKTAGKGSQGLIVKAWALPDGAPHTGEYYPVIQWGTLRRVSLPTGQTVNTEVKANNVQQGKDGYYLFSATTPAVRYTLNEDCMVVKEETMPSLLDGNTFSAWSGGSSVWAGDETGLGNYSVGADGKVTVKRDKSLSSDAISMTNICRIYPTADGEGFYTANIGQSHTHPIGSADRIDVVMEAALCRDGQFTPFKPETAGGETVIAPTAILEDPDDPSIVYVASTTRGIYVFRDNRQIALIDDTNSLMTRMGGWILSPSWLSLDPQGNLWVGYVTLDASKPSIMMLPAAKRREISSVKSSDWLQPDFGSLFKGKDITVFNCLKSDVTIAFDAPYYGFVAYYRGKDPTDLSQAGHIEWTNVYDQDGNPFSPGAILSIAEDHDGQVWLGTTNGVYTIPNPVKALSTDFIINRVKVPRNDGTNLADYLLDSDRINVIAVDNSNRKWIGTNGSGLFLVSESGDEILAHYTTSNSPLPTNQVTAVYPSPASNSVFIGTLAGLLEFSSTSGPARPDYSDVYAYPNPVTPDYTGLVTITGLMADSMVKIVDAGFNTVCQTMSEGGLAIWDVCNMNGERVRSGIYYVVASTSGETSSAGDVVCKILVIN